MVNLWLISTYNYLQGRLTNTQLTRPYKTNFISHNIQISSVLILSPFWSFLFLNKMTALDKT